MSVVFAFQKTTLTKYIIFFEDITGGVRAPTEWISIDSSEPVDGGCQGTYRVEDP